MPRKRTPAASRCWQILSKAIPGAKERQGTQIKITGKEDQNISTGRKVKTRIRSRGLKGLLALRLNRDCGIYLSTFPVVWYDGAPNHLLCSVRLTRATRGRRSHLTVCTFGPSVCLGWACPLSPWLVGALMGNIRECDSRENESLSYVPSRFRTGKLACVQ